MMRINDFLSNIVLIPSSRSKSWIFWKITHKRVWVCLWLIWEQSAAWQVVLKAKHKDALFPGHHAMLKALFGKTELEKHHFALFLKTVVSVSWFHENTAWGSLGVGGKTSSHRHFNGRLCQKTRAFMPRGCTAVHRSRHHDWTIRKMVWKWAVLTACCVWQRVGSLLATMMKRTTTMIDDNYTKGTHEPFCKLGSKQVRFVSVKAERPNHPSWGGVSRCGGGGVLHDPMTQVWLHKAARLHHTQPKEEGFSQSA